MVAVRKPGTEADKAGVLALYAQSVPRWSVPDDVIFVASLPVGGTGKIVKKQLREDYVKGKLA